MRFFSSLLPSLQEMLEFLNYVSIFRCLAMVDWFSKKGTLIHTKTAISVLFFCVFRALHACLCSFRFLIQFWLIIKWYKPVDLSIWLVGLVQFDLSQRRNEISTDRSIAVTRSTCRIIYLTCIPNELMCMHSNDKYRPTNKHKLNLKFIHLQIMITI